MKKIILERFYQPEKKQSYFLFGPRGTGKSRFLKYYYKEATFINLLDDKTYLMLTNNPSRLEPLIKDLKDESVVVIDEVQKSPQLLSKVHEIMEDDNFPKIQFVLTGSSSRKLKRAGVDLLGGRAILNFMHPFMAAELGSHFKLQKYLDLGLLPIVFGADNPEKTLQSYIAVYLREEVKQEGLVKNLESFSRFLEAMSFSHGEILNLSNVSRDCAVKRSTLDGYIEVLEDLMLSYRLQSFKKKNRKDTVSSEKFYYFDVGVYKSLRPFGPLDEIANIAGPALEGLVVQNLRAWISYRNKNEEMYFWRTSSGVEVDIVIYGPNKFMAIEVKNTTKITSSHLSGLKSFHEDYPSAECIFLYRGKTREKHGSIQCMPVDEFLLTLK